MRLKEGVQLRALAPQLIIAMIAADQVLDGQLVVTSITDSEHSAGSLHYVGHAFDCRLPADPQGFVQRLRERLGGEFDVVLEKNHVHVEYQPKRRAS